jgi:hypothetical protein
MIIRKALLLALAGLFLTLSFCVPAHGQTKIVYRGFNPNATCTDSTDVYIYNNHPVFTNGLYQCINSAYVPVNLVGALATDIRSYGAVCDGVTDDGPAFDRALDAVVLSQSLGQRELVLPPFPSACKIATPVIKSFASTNDILIRGSQSGSIIFLATGASVDAFQLSNAYSITFRDITFRGVAINGSNTVDARTAFLISGIIKLLVENCNFYFIYSPNGIWKISQTASTFHECKFRGSTASSGAAAAAIYSLDWNGIVVTGCHFVDYGDLNGSGFITKTSVSSPTAWITTEKPHGEITETISGTTPPTSANIYAQNTVTVTDNYFDEGALRSLHVVSNTGTGEPYTSRVYIARNNTNANIVGGIGGYYLQHIRTLVFDQNYVGYAYGGDTIGLYLDDVQNATVRNSQFEQRAGVITVRNGGNVTLENCRYTSVDTDGNSTITVNQDGGAIVRRTPSSGVITRATLTGLASNVSMVKGANVASAGTIVPTGNMFTITGTTTISTITMTGVEIGTPFWMITTSALTFDEAGNIDVTGGTSLVTTANYLVVGVWDGTKVRIR